MLAHGPTFAVHRIQAAGRVPRIPAALMPFRDGTAVLFHVDRKRDLRERRLGGDTLGESLANGVLPLADRVRLAFATLGAALDATPARHTVLDPRSHAATLTVEMVRAGRR